MLDTIKKYINTLKYLKVIQIRYQLWYRIRRIWRKLTKFTYPLSVEQEHIKLDFQPWIDKNESFHEFEFSFLNISKKFNKTNINWNDLSDGPLWSYNLNYMDYLLQPNIKVENACYLIQNFISNLYQNSVGLDPYPIALRGINCIKFISKNTIDDPRIINSLYAQYCILYDNLEYHLLANHLLEDAFSLLFGAFFFKEDRFYSKAKKILKNELEEQILKDGAHFELSPMYHQIILDRLLDCINLLQSNKLFDDQVTLHNLMKEKSIKMLNWLTVLTFRNDRIPLFNDSTVDIAPDTSQLVLYAKTLGIELNYQPLKDSGYRKFSGENYECIIDIGDIGPSYQPGHAHADTFNFVINSNNKSLIIDPGISTYNSNQDRIRERSTALHNTVTIEDSNSSQVWSSFRVAERAFVQILEDTPNHVVATHNGYRGKKTTHQREWTFNDNSVIIKDRLDGRVINGLAHFWFDKTIKLDLENNTVNTQYGSIKFDKGVHVKIIEQQIPDGYNKFVFTNKIEVSFNSTLKTTFSFSLIQN